MRTLYIIILLLFSCNTFAQLPYHKLDFCNKIATDSFATSIYFESGSYNLSTENKKSIDSILSLVKKQKAYIYRISFYGYADTVGEIDENKTLSQKRVLAAIDYYNTNKVIRKLCVGISEYSKPFFTLADSLIDTLKLYTYKYYGEQNVYDDNFIANRRVDILVHLIPKYGPGCGGVYGYCEAPKQDTSIYIDKIKIELPKGIYSHWSKGNFTCDYSDSFHVAIKSQFYKKRISRGNNFEFNICRLIEIHFTPHQFYNISEPNNYYHPYSTISLKIPLTYCEAMSKVRLYSYHKNGEHDDSIELQELKIFNLPKNIIEQQKIIVEDGISYIYASVNIKDMDSLVLISEKRTRQKILYRKLIFKGNKKLNLFVLDDCSLLPLDNTPKKFLFFKHTEGYVTDNERFIYIQSDTPYQYWKLSISKMKKRWGNYVLTKKQLKKIIEKKPITIYPETFTVN